MIATITANDEGMIVANRRLNPTSVNPRLLGDNSNIEEMNPTKDQLPTT
jgi:hypothetical protein